MFKKNIIFSVAMALILCFCAYGLSARTNDITAHTKVVIQKFVNISEYKGKWSIDMEFPKLLREQLLASGFKDVELAKEGQLSTNALIVSGEIEKFKFKEHIIAAYKVGGYKNYVVDIAVTIKADSLKQDLYKEKYIETYITKKSYGLTILNGPGGTDDFELNIYEELQKIPFGSKKFWNTVYGVAVKECVEKMMDWMTKELIK